jgi:PAS domain S-box-containing protein
VRLLQPEGRLLHVRRLTEITRALTAALSEEEILELAVKETGELLGSEKVAIVLTEARGGLSIRASVAVRNGLQQLQGERFESLNEEVIARLQDVLGADERNRFLAVPMVMGGEVAGVLAVAGQPPPHLGADDEEWLLSAIADQAAVSLEKLRLNQAAAAAQKARREREEQFQSLYHSPLLGLVFRSRGGEVVDANDAFLSLSGYSRAEVEAGSLRWDALLVRKLPGRDIPSQTNFKARMRPYEGELLRSDGQRVDVLVGTARLEEQERDLLFVVDISAQKRAEGSLRLLSETSTALLGASLDFEALFKSIAWLVVPRFADWCAVESVEEGATTGQHVALESLSPCDIESALEWRRRFPPDPRSKIGVAEVIRTGRSQLHREVPDTLLAEYACAAEHSSALRRAGLRSAILAPMLMHGKVVGVVTFVRSSSRRRFSAEDLLLAEELARRAASAQEKARLYQRAQEAIGLRDEFLSIAAHELKTPLTTLQLQLDMLKKSIAGGGVKDEKLGWRVASVMRQTDRLTRLVEDLLDISRITAGRMTLNQEVCDLVEIVQEVLGSFEALAKHAGSTLETDLPCEPVRGRWDRSRIEQVIVNIVSNALKYGAGKPVRVSVEVADGDARLIVTDEGMGISQQDIGRIFERFERAVSAQHYGGLGLGLFIARQVVEAHGGEIHVASRPGRGAEFVVELPMLAPGEESVTDRMQ